MNKKTKALIYTFLCFMPIFVICRILIAKYTGFTGWKIPVASALITFILSPKFEAFRTNEGEKIFMKWLLMKGTKIID